MSAWVISQVRAMQEASRRVPEQRNALRDEVLLALLQYVSDFRQSSFCARLIRLLARARAAYTANDIARHLNGHATTQREDVVDVTLRQEARVTRGSLLEFR